jgi:hypothetical protein
VFFPRLFAQWTLLDFSSQRLELGSEELAHLTVYVSYARVVG